MDTKLIEALPVSKQVIWLDPLAMDSATNRAWEDGGLDDARTMLAERVGSVGLRFVQPLSRRYRMRRAAAVAQATETKLIVSLAPLKPWSKTEPKFDYRVFDARTAQRLVTIGELAKAWADVMDPKEIVVLLGHEEWVNEEAYLSDKHVRLLRLVEETLASALPEAEKWWYNAGHRWHATSDIFQGIPKAIVEHRKFCSLYYADVQRAHETHTATGGGDPSYRIVTKHMFDEAWCYVDAGSPWGKRQMMPFVDERATLYHRAVGELCGYGHARVTSRTKITKDYLRNLGQFIKGVNGDE